MTTLLILALTIFNTVLALIGVWQRQVTTSEALHKRRKRREKRAKREAKRSLH